MSIFLATALSFNVLNTPISINEKNTDWLQIEHSSEIFQGLSNCDLNDQNIWEDYTCPPMEELLEGDLVLFGTSVNEIQQMGVYLGNEEFVHVSDSVNATDLRINKLTDSEWSNAAYPYRTVLRHTLRKEASVVAAEPTINQKAPSSILTQQNNCYYVNDQQLPLVVSPKDLKISLPSFKKWAEAHQKELRSLLAKEGAILLRDFPVENAEDFASVVKAVIGRELLDYRGGEGSRKKVADGVYTSTEAPPFAHIPLHNELSCTNNPAAYICFYCDIAPDQGTGQTILGSTEKVNQEMMQHPNVWNLFYGKKVKHISRHPPEGSFIAKVNKTHKTWPEAFETHDKQEVERICREKGFEFNWLGDWLEVIRLVPAIRDPDGHFDHPYWCNQIHMYHQNPRIRGGWFYHILANLLYIDPSTLQYEVVFEDNTPISNEVAYEIFDVMDNQIVKFDWQKGDILLMDNIKALHGRAPYSGQRRILVSMVP